MKRALVSVSDKTGLIDFLKPLVERGLEIISTGGTLKFLNENALPAKDITELTGFPEVLDGRVKTLHPFVHMGLLARRELSSHVSQMQKHQVDFFDLVLGNLYPFEKTALNESASFEELVENIDIGGPSFLRSSAKNFQNVVVVSDPTDYAWVQKKILTNDLSLADRKKLAMKVYSLTSYYDAMIVQKLSDPNEELNYLNIPLKKKQSLRYGENAHQSAIWFENPLAAGPKDKKSDGRSLAQAEILQGKELSYNNLLDIDAASELVSHFSQPGCVAVKHNNPCGVAIDQQSLLTATQKAVAADPKSVFGGILAFNKTVDEKIAEFLNPIFLECLVAPDYTDAALKIFSSKKSLRVLRWKQMSLPAKAYHYRSVAGGLLVQNADSFSEAEEWKYLGSKPSEEIKQTMLFGEKVAAFLKSNAIALVYKGQTVGLGMGQVNRVDSVTLALKRFEFFKQGNSVNVEEVVAISDAFFPFADSLESLQAAGIKWVVQPGGSVRDAEVIDYAEKHNMNMVLTGQRHFRH